MTVVVKFVFAARAIGQRVYCCVCAASQQALRVRTRAEAGRRGIRAIGLRIGSVVAQRRASLAVRVQRRLLDIGRVTQQHRSVVVHVHRFQVRVHQIGRVRSASICHRTRTGTRCGRRGGRGRRMLAVAVVQAARDQVEFGGGLLQQTIRRSLETFVRRCGRRGGRLHGSLRARCA